MTNPAIHFAFLDVAQGDCSVILLPRNRAVVIDCPAGGVTVLDQYLRDHNVTQIALAVVTHSCADHLGGMVRVLNNSRRRVVPELWILPDRPPTTRIARDSAEYRANLERLANLVRQQRIKLVYPSSGTSANYDGLHLEVLHPELATNLAVHAGVTSRNNASMVLSASFGQFRVLYGGDVEGEGWAAITSNGTPLTANVLKVPHHGGWWSAPVTQADLASAVSADIGTISVGTRNDYGHPKLDTLRGLRAAGTRIMCTEATEECYGNSKGVAALITRQLATLPTGRYRLSGTRRCACCGSIEVTVSGSGKVQVSPGKARHDRIRRLMPNVPLCRR